MLLYDVMFCLLGDLIVGHLELGEEDGAVLGSPAVNDRDDLDPPAHCPQVPQVLYRPLHRLGHNNPHSIRDRAKKNIQSAKCSVSGGGGGTNFFILPKNHRCMKNLTLCIEIWHTVQFIVVKKC